MIGALLALGVNLLLFFADADRLGPSGGAGDPGEGGVKSTRTGSKKKPLVKPLHRISAISAVSRHAIRDCHLHASRSDSSKSEATPFVSLSSQYVEQNSSKQKSFYIATSRGITLHPQLASASR